MPSRKFLVLLIVSIFAFASIAIAGPRTLSNGISMPTNRLMSASPDVPSGGSPLSEYATVTLLASYAAYTPGSGHPLMPIRGHYEYGATTKRVPLYKGFDLVVGESFDIKRGSSNAPNQDLFLRIAYPSWVPEPPHYNPPTFSIEKGLSSGDVIVLTANTNFYSMTNGKVDAPYNSQKSLEQILIDENLLNPQTGEILLDPGQAIFAYNLVGPDTPSCLENKDYNDGVVLVHPKVGQIPSVAKDQIGEGGVLEGGLLGFSAFRDYSGISYTLPATVFTANKTGKLSEYSSIVYGVRSNSDDCILSEWPLHTYVIHFWPSVADYFADPQHGQEFYFNEPTNPDYLTIVGYREETAAIHNKLRFEFEMTSQNIDVIKGQQYVIGINAIPGADCEMGLSFSIGGGIGDEVDVYSQNWPTHYPPQYVNNISAAPTDWYATAVTID